MIANSERGRIATSRDGTIRTRIFNRPLVFNCDMIDEDVYIHTYTTGGVSYIVTVADDTVVGCNIPSLTPHTFVSQPKHGGGHGSH